jgi:hypothetical protein
MKRGSLSNKSLGKVLLPAAVAGLLLTNHSAPAQTLSCCPETNGVKFIALPWVYGGMDVKDSRNSIVLADDFFCNTPGPITDIHIWGSWLGDDHGTITNFWLGIYNDVPAGTNTSGGPVPSHPGTNLLWSQSFLPSQFCETSSGPASETFYNPTNGTTMGGDYTVWYYCFYPTNPFVQQGQPGSPTNYWLAARAQLAQDNSLYGWKTSICGYNDAAVWGTVDATGLPNGDWQSMINPTNSQPINLAFKITTAVQPIPCVETNGLKYDQEPNVYYGLDVWDSSPRPVQLPPTDGPWWLADDFVCTNSGPITDIHLWGSWQYDSPLSNSITFQLYVFDNVPTNSGNLFSHPGTNVLWHQTFTPNNYAERVWTTNAVESFLDPGQPQILGPDTVVWYYCFYPTNLYQCGSNTAPITYWLAAFAELPRCVTNVFGWKTTTSVQHDISVHAPWGGYNMAPPNTWQPNYQYTNQNGPFDLAFKLTTQTNSCPLPVIECTNPVFECGTSWAITPPPVLDQCCPPPIPAATLAAQPVTNGTACSQVITLVWKYTDCQMRTVYSTNTVTVHDTTPPVLYCTNLVLACGDQSYTNPPAAYDACCGTNVTVTLPGSTNVSSGCGQTIYQTWQATDCCGNSAQCVRKVSIVPGLGLQDLVVPNANANVEGNFGNEYPFDIGANGISSMRYQQVYDASQFGAVPAGGAYITALAFRVDAGFGAFAATLPSIQINLSTTPSVPDGLSTTFANNVGPDDTVVYSGALQLSSAAIGSPAAFDIIIPLTTSFWYNPVAGDLLLDVRNFGGGTSQQFDAVNTTNDSVSRVYSLVSVGDITGATDTTGLVTEFTLGVGTINLPCSNLVINCGSPIPTNAPVPLDACCTNVTVTLGYSNVTYGPCVQTIYRYWNAVDCCGWAGCGQTIQVMDTNPPVFYNCITGKTVQCMSNWVFDTPVAKYYCSGSNVLVGVIGTATNNPSACLSVATCTWAATNLCSGAVATCVEAVTILDTNPPVFNGCIAAKTEQCGSGWGFDTPTATYLCSGSNVFVGIVYSNTNILSACTNVQTRIWGATNACSGAVATCTQVVTVIDTIPPVIASCPTNMVVYTCDTNPVVVPWPTNASDTCSSVTVTSAPPYGTPFPPNSTNTVVLSAHDACGNSNGCTFTVTVRRPVLSGITYSVNGDNLVLQWTIGILQQAPTVLGPWTDVADAPPPSYSTPLNGPERFFRLRCASP